MDLVAQLALALVVIAAWLFFARRNWRRIQRLRSSYLPGAPRQQLDAMIAGLTVAMLALGGAIALLADVPLTIAVLGAAVLVAAISFAMGFRRR